MLWGTPGAGKTTLAAEYGKWHSAEHAGSVVVWIDSDQQAKIDQSVRKILVQDLEIKKEEYQEKEILEKRKIE